MLIEKLEQGRCRAAIRCGNLVIKYPHLGNFLALFRDLPKALKENCRPGLRVQIIKFRFKSCFRWFVEGIRKNVEELELWWELKPPFLARTIFGFGLFNVQVYKSGAMPTNDGLESLFRKFSECAYIDLKRGIDPHCLGPQNFKLDSSGFHLIDYGDEKFSRFIRKYRRELEMVFGTISDYSGQS